MGAATIRISGKESSERSASTPTSGGPGSSSTIRIWLVVAATAATAGGLIAIVLQHVEPLPGDFQIPWWAIALMFAVGELCAVHLEFRRESHTFTLSELALVAGLLFATPLSLLAGRLVGASLLLVHDRRRPIKIAFNLSLFALETAVAIGVFHLVTRQIETFTPLTLAGVFAATFTASLMGVGLIFLVISISEGSFELSRLGPASAVGLTITAANTSIALVAAEAFKHSSTSVLLLAVPAAVVFVAYRALVGARDKHSRLAFLHETSTLVARSPKLETAMQDVLVRTCSMFRAEVAELLLLTPEDARAGLRMVVRSEDDRPDFHDVELGSDELTFRVLAERRPILVRRGEATDALLGHLPGLELKDAIVVPVSGEEALLGVLLVGNRLGDVSTFSRDDVRLVETLASQLGVSLENARLGKSLGRLTELSAQLQHQAFHDPLTGLANRVLFTEKLELALARQKRMQSRLAVLFVDIDDFKAVNDFRGHEAGDALLSAVADRLRSCLREVDTPARLGGDEFALLLEELADDEDAIAVAQRIVDSFADPVDIDGTPASVSVSIGVALAADAISAERILNDSDIAMYRAKARGKAQFTVFEPSMRVELLAPIEMRVNLRHAFSRGELSLRYQPVVSLTTSRLEGVEALMRWQRSATEAIPPNEFIPVAEECGLIGEIGGWALREACRQRAAWKVAGEQEIEPWVSVNVSRRQLERDSFVDEVSEALQESGLDPHLLVLEITETIALRDDSGLPLLPVLEQLKALGVRIALDDFGSGYSAFSVLQTLPLDILKLDRHFVESIGSKPQATELTRTIVEVARTFGLVTIAEGAERRDQLDVLSSMGCDLAQGFLFSSPLDAQGIEALLRQQALGHWFTALDPTSLRRLRVVDGGRRSA